jgi:isopentenyl phosphate kinase
MELPTGMHCLVVKVGGALLTTKTGIESVDPKGLHAAVQVLSNVWRTFKAQGTTQQQQRLVIAHGAGSFGHNLASKLGLSGSNVVQSANQGAHAASVHSSVTKLNALLVSALVDAGVPCVGVSPLVTGVEFDGNDEVLTGSVLSDTVERLWDLGCVPVIHGDVVFGRVYSSKKAELDVNDNLGIRILSADVIVENLCAMLSTRRRHGTALGRSVHAVFMTDVDGVFSGPPDEPRSQLVPTIRVSPHLRSESEHESDLQCTPCAIDKLDTATHEKERVIVCAATGGDSSSDCTGGMLLKLRMARLIAAAGGVQVRIVNGMREQDALTACLPSDSPNTWVGTSIIQREDMTN